MRKLKSLTKRIVIDNFGEISINDKGVYPFEYCSKLYNFNNTNKVLEHGLGVGTLKLPVSNSLGSENVELDLSNLQLPAVNKVMHFKQYFLSEDATTHRLLVYGSDKRLYIYEMFAGTTNLNWLYQLSFEQEPVVLAYKKNGLDSILISSKDKIIVWSTNLLPYELTNVPTITSMAIYDDVLYCTIKGETHKIWYTSDLNPEIIGVESDRTKFISLSDERGACRKIITFKENLYVFRDYGISRIDTYTKNTPNYNQVYLSDSKIYANTVSVCGDVVIFMTRDGLYKFNGTSVSKIDIPTKLIANINDYAVATNMQDKYYLALKLGFDDNKQILCEQESDCKNNALIVIDLQTYAFEVLRGVDIKSMLALKADSVEKIVLTFNSKDKDKIGEITNDGKYFEQNLPKYYESNYLVEKNMSGCTIRKITVDATKNVTVKLVTDIGVVNFTTYTDGINEFQTIVPCKKFKFEISSNENSAIIRHIEIEYVKRK